MTEVRNRADKQRFEITLDGEVAGYTEYRSAPGVRAFAHTVVQERFQGQGLAAKLVGAALDATGTERLAAGPHCRYVRNFIAEHAEYLDLVAEDRRAEFGLPSTPRVERKSA